MTQSNNPKLPNTKLFINNQWVDPIVKQSFEIVNPATEQVICNIDQADKADVDLAVAAAREALENGPWPKLTATQRGQLMFKLADLIDKNRDWLAQLETVDVGKPYNVSRDADVTDSANTIRYFAGWADKIQGKVIQAAANNLTAFTRHEPVGVAGFIIPWNYPLLILCWKLGPALAAGCTVVCKPSEVTPLTALAMCDLLVEAGFPKGVFNLVNGPGPTVGEAITRHPDVDKVSFTGSTRAGRHIMAAAAASNLKKVTLELGGKSPNIVFDDADLSIAVKGSIDAIYPNTGQCCCAGTRLYVQEGIYDKFVEEFVTLAKKLTVGDPFTKVDQGPLASEAHLKNVLNFIEIGKKEGKLLLGGERAPIKGYFVQPTIFTDLSDDACVGKDEIFGPVVCIFKFKTVEEVIKRANNTQYGLAAGLWTKDINKAHRVEKKLKAGTVWINDFNFTHFLIPFGGYKQSGFGKDLSEYAIQDYCSVKAVVLNHGEPY